MMHPEYENKILEAATIIKNAHRVVVFTGAGISVESGIPDFRSSGGLWEKYDPAIYATYSHFLEHPEKYWTMAKEILDLISSVQPNQAHLSLAELELKYNKVKTVITQNIDSLHTIAGNTNVLELHGTFQLARCLNCKKNYSIDDIKQKLSNNEIPPICIDCGGIIKDKAILFGEPLPDNIMSDAVNEVINSDCIIIVGSSLTVYPAALIPTIAMERNLKSIIINKDPTPHDLFVTVTIQGEAGTILPEIVKKIESLS